MALGATPARLVWLVVVQVAMLTLGGLAIGFAAALVVAPRIEPLLFDVSATDPRVYGLVAATLLVVAAGAAARPAWRVARTDPSEALRAE